MACRERFRLDQEAYVARGTQEPSELALRGGVSKRSVPEPGGIRAARSGCRVGERPKRLESIAQRVPEDAEFVGTPGWDWGFNAWPVDPKPQVLVDRSGHPGGWGRAHV